MSASRYLSHSADMDELCGVNVSPPGEQTAIVAQTRERRMTGLLIAGTNGFAQFGIEGLSRGAKLELDAPIARTPFR